MPNESPREVYAPEASPAARFAETYKRFLTSVERSILILDHTAPDTFLGRKTQEPFPLEES